VPILAVSSHVLFPWRNCSIIKNYVLFLEMKNLKKILDLVALTNSFRQIERDIPLSQGSKLENDAEHSYQLTVISWYIATIENNSLDINKILKYALVHDLVEVYADDTPLYTSDHTYINTKENRENNAALQLEKEFPNFADLHIWIKNYKEKTDDESKFVFAIDKLLPIMSIYLDDGHGWRSHNITLSMIVSKNKKRISVSPTVKKYFNLMLKIIREKPEFLKGDMKLFKKAINHNGERCSVCHVDVNHFDDIPDELKLKAHAVCINNGKMLLVNHPEWDIWSIPGGTRDEGESIEETLKREILEETNCKVVDYRPIAYQKVIGPLGDIRHYRLQYMCDVVPLGDFKEDPAGNVDKISWIRPSDFERYIENKEFKRVVIRRALELLETYENQEYR